MKEATVYIEERVKEYGDQEKSSRLSRRRGKEVQKIEIEGEIQ